MIEADQVYRSYTLAKKKIEVLRGVNLKIESGEKVFLCGPSGAGKTTLMYTLAGLENPHEGRVRIDGTDFINCHQVIRQVYGTKKLVMFFRITFYCQS